MISIADQIYAAKASFIFCWDKVPEKVVMRKEQMEQLRNELEERNVLANGQEPKTIHGLKMRISESAIAVYCE